MKGLEKVYLQRLEHNQNGNPIQQKQGSKKKRKQNREGATREFMDRFYDDPQYITRGEKLKLETKDDRHSRASGGGKFGSGIKTGSQDSHSLMEAGYAISHQTPFGVMPQASPQN